MTDQVVVTDKRRQKTLNILTNKGASGEQGFLVNRDFQQLVSFRLSESQLSDGSSTLKHRRQPTTVVGNR
jgi:hypothetical protein